MKVTEKALFWRCFFSSLLLLVSIITLSVAWGHWAYTVDLCPTYNCGCILFARAYSNNFAGGPVEVCQFVVYAQAPLLIIAVTLTIYHGYRVYFKRRNEKTTAMKRNPLLYVRQGGSTRNDKVLDSEPSEPEPDPPSYKMAATLVAFSIVVLAMLLTIFILTTYGFYFSCGEYRKSLITNLGASGNVADVLNSRVQCTSVFDFLDYLQEDRIAYNKPRDMQYMRKDRINTGITLLIAKSVLLMNSLNWVFISVYNIVRLKATGKSCCCRSSS